MQHVLCVTVAIVFAWAGQSKVSAAPTADHVLSAYTQNFERLGHYRVTWAYTITSEAGHVMDKAETIRQIDKMLRQGSLSSEMEKQLEEYRKDVSDASKVGVRKQTATNDVWTDGERIQVRAWKQTKLNEDLSSNMFPSAPVSTESLAVDYGDITIASFSPRASPRTRMWGGVIAGRGRGSLSDGGLMSVFSGALMPPIGRSPSGQDYQLHALDQHMSYPANEYSISGEQRVNESRCWVLERTEETDSPMAGATWKKETLLYCDLSRGGIPIRVVVSTWPLRHGKTIPGFEPQITDLLEVSEVQELPNSQAFYPSKGSLEHRKRGQSGSDLHLSTFSWIANVDDSVNCPTQLFEFALPENMDFVDQRTGDRYSVGLDKHRVETAIRGVIPTTGVWFPSLIAATGFGVVLVGLLFYRIRRGN